MHRGITTILRISTLLVVASGFFSLITTYVFPVEILLIPLLLFLLMPLGERMDLRSRQYRRVSTWITILYMLLIPVMFVAIGLLGTVIALVIFIIAYALLHHKSEREYQYLYLMSFFLLLASCMLSPEPSIALVMALFMINLIVAMIMLQLETESKYHAGTAPGTLFSLRQESAASPEPAEIRKGGLPVLVGAIAASCVLLTAALFMATPRIEAGLLGRSDPALMTVGRSQRVDVAQGGTILRDQTPVMRVSFPDEPNGQYDGLMLWRCTSLPQFDSPEWTRRSLSPSQADPTFALSGKKIRGTIDNSTGREKFNRRRSVRQVIYMNEVPADGAPALPLVQKFTVIEGGGDVALSWDTNADFSLLVNKRGQRWLQYEAVSEVDTFVPADLQQAPDNYAAVIPPRDFNLLTKFQFQSSLQKEVDRMLADEPTVYDKVAAVMAYLNSSEFQYSRTVPTLPEANPVETFLTQTKIGHCQLFASAMALMLRSEGIPTRVVSGYRGGEWSDRDKAYIVRAEMGHMWVEVYFIGLGWISFDPSPPEVVRLSPMSAFSRTLSRYVLKAKMVWYRNVISFDSKAQFGALRNMTTGFISFTSGLFESIGNFGSGTTPVSLIFMVIAVLAAAGAIAIAAGALGPKSPLTPDQLRAVTLYQALLRKLNRIGIAVHNRTAEEILDDVAPFLEVQPAAMAIVRVYNECRFGARLLPVATASELQSSLRHINCRRLKINPQSTQ